MRMKHNNTERVKTCCIHRIAHKEIRNRRHFQSIYRKSQAMEPIIELQFVSFLSSIPSCASCVVSLAFCVEFQPRHSYNANNAPIELMVDVDSIQSLAQSAIANIFSHFGICN